MEGNTQLGLTKKVEATSIIEFWTHLVDAFCCGLPVVWKHGQCSAVIQPDENSTCVSHPLHAVVLLSQCVPNISMYFSAATLLDEYAPEYTCTYRLCHRQTHTHTQTESLSLPDAMQIRISHAVQFSLTCSTLIIQ